MFKESLRNDFLILEMGSIRSTSHFAEVSEKRGNFPVAAPRSYYYLLIQVNLFRSANAEAKVSFKFVFDFKMEVLVVVNNLFFQPS